MAFVSKAGIERRLHRVRGYARVYAPRRQDEKGVPVVRYQGKEGEMTKLEFLTDCLLRELQNTTGDTRRHILRQHRGFSLVSQITGKLVMK